VRRALISLAVVGIGVLLSTAASAHPLGNFTINQYSGLRVEANAVIIDLVTDEAEIPTVQARSEMDTNHDKTVDDAEASVWRMTACRTAAAQTALTLDDHPATVQAQENSSLSFPTGQADLLTLRLECTLRSDVAVPDGVHTLSYKNTGFDGRLGWHEIVVSSPGITLLTTGVATTSITERLTRYPTDLLRSPLQQRTLSISFQPTGALASPSDATTAATAPAVTKLLPRGVDRAGQAFTRLIARRHLTFSFGLLAFAVAILLGAFHALAPGHGKTVMAAYIVGERGTLRQAGLIGLSVTATHTAGVMVLGILLSTSTVLTPDRLYPWLGLASGLLLASIGVTLARRALRTSHVHRPQHHDHPHHHESEPRDHRVQPIAVAHSHGGWTHTHQELDPSLSWRSLLAVGFAGGLVPSPSALLVLLGAIALGRVAFGLLLVVAYGLGMALMLVAAGLALVRARTWIERRAPRPGRRRVATLGRLVPIATSAIVIVVGLSLAIRSALKI
jgi:nickel/cobalt transporter (NicO) family protein